MEIEVVSRRENALLKRTEVRFVVRHPKEPSPARDALRQELAKHLNSTKDVVVVDHARSVFGRAVSEGFAKVYKSKDDALRTERGFVLVRNRLKEAQVKAKKEPRARPAPAKPAVREVKADAKAAEKAPPPAPKKEAPKPEGPAKKEAPKKEEKPAEKKPGKGA